MSIKEGDTVRLMCEAKLESGELCYKNEADNPIEMVVGEGKFFPPIEKALQGMNQGESRVITLEPDDAFGPHLADLVIKVPRTVFQTDVDLEINSRIKIDMPTGKSFVGTVVAMDEQTFTLDLNHLLAGKRLIVSFTVLSVAEKVAEKVKT
jgi:FKBP-type peptidyl-prolyl cis-trans isomerase 2